MTSSETYIVQMLTVLVIPALIAAGTAFWQKKKNRKIRFIHVLLPLFLFIKGSLTHTNEYFQNRKIDLEITRLRALGQDKDKSFEEISQLISELPSHTTFGKKASLVEYLRENFLMMNFLEKELNKAGERLQKILTADAFKDKEHLDKTAEKAVLFKGQITGMSQKYKDFIPKEDKWIASIDFKKLHWNKDVFLRVVQKDRASVYKRLELLTKIGSQLEECINFFISKEKVTFASKDELEVSKLQLTKLFQNLTESVKELNFLSGATSH